MVFEATRVVRSLHATAPLQLFRETPGDARASLPSKLCYRTTNRNNLTCEIKQKTMSNQKDNKQRKNDHLLKSLPTEVLLKARSTLVSLSGALKPKNEQQQPKFMKQDSKDKKITSRLKISRSEPEFSDIRRPKHKSRIDGGITRESGGKPRPLSVGAVKRYEEVNEFESGSFPKDLSPINQRQFESSEDVSVQSRLVIPVAERLSSQDINLQQDGSERPRKKLSFREPEIVGSGSATLGRSNKLMGVNSLTRRPNRISLRSEIHSSLEGIDSDLEVLTSFIY